MQIFVKTLRGRTITLDLERCDCVMEAKVATESKTGIRAELQRFIFGGKETTAGEFPFTALLGAKKVTDALIIICKINKNKL